MLYPHEIQACLLFDRRVDTLDAIMRAFTATEGQRSGARFNQVECKPGVFHRLYGGDNLMVTLEYCDNPANPAVFGQVLGSTVTGIVCPDIRDRIARSRSHILINVSHGALGNSPELARLMAQIGREPEGHSLAHFRRRLAVCAMISRIAFDHARPSAVHWTQSNQLIPGEHFEDYARGDAPGLLHIHPWLFGDRNGPGGKAAVGIRTFGARHFIGRELLIEPSILPWSANYETLLAFLRIATTENGYIIPDGDTFGPEDRSLSYRVLHRPAAADDVPLYELQPLMFREHGFVSPDYVSPERAFDDRVPPADLMPVDDWEKMGFVNEWREKRKLAERIGGRFEVRAKGTGPMPTPPPPQRPGVARLFGRKGL
ncbi:hypothetical protein ABC347_12805 [Sphingomonas sp. 1P06PA]|uniref:hypothetical protein n=1 Tax=Sphingomonas sp. 1P06PA TaxID=554121 RepID=UPI0039A5CD81